MVLSTTAVSDTLWSIPAIKYLKENSDFRVTILISNRSAGVLNSNPYIDKYLFNTSNFLTRLKNIFIIYFSTYHASFNFHVSKRLESYIGYLASPKKYYGIYPECKNPNVLTDGIRYAEFKNLHKIDMRISLFQRFLKLPQAQKQCYLEMFPTSTDYKVSKELLCYTARE